MALHTPPFKVPPQLKWRRHARNGRVVTSHNPVYSGLNHVAVHRGHGMMHSVPLGAIPAALSGTNLWWPMAMRVAPGTTHIRALVGLAKPGNAAATNPSVYLKITDGVTGGTAIDSNSINDSGETGGTTEVPDDITWAPCEAAIGAAGADRVYRCELYTVDYANPVAVMLSEVVALPIDDSNTWASRQTIGTGNAILDSDYSDALSQADSLWSGMGGYLITWCRKSAATQPSIASTTFTNILDGSSTAVSSSSPGYRVVNAYHQSYSATTVNVRLMVYAAHTSAAGSAGEVKITDGTNTLTVGSITGTGGWFSTTGSWPVSGTSGTKTDIHARITLGANPITVGGVYLWEEE